MATVVSGGSAGDAAARGRSPSERADRGPAAFGLDGVAAGPGRLLAYASVIDDRTNDPIDVPATQ